MKRIEMTAAVDAVGDRALLHRYHLRYDPGSYHSLLQEVVLEGRAQAFDSAVGAVVATDTPRPEQTLGDAIVGPTQHPIRFSYTAAAARAGFHPLGAGCPAAL